MHQIHKVEIPPGTPAGGGIGVTMPSGAKVLHVSFGDSRIFVHMLINTMNPLITRQFVIFGDGMMVGKGPDGRTVEQLEHAGTVVVDIETLKGRGQIVMHVFDGGETAAQEAGRV